VRAEQTRQQWRSRRDVVAGGRVDRDCGVVRAHDSERSAMQTRPAAMPAPADRRLEQLQVVDRQRAATAHRGAAQAPKRVGQAAKESTETASPLRSTKQNSGCRIAPESQQAAQLAQVGGAQIADVGHLGAVDERAQHATKRDW
jgi:hypothetical protein